MGKGHTSPSSPSSPSSPHHFLFLPLHPLLPWSRFSSLLNHSSFLIISHVWVSGSSFWPIHLSSSREWRNDSVATFEVQVSRDLRRSIPRIDSSESTEAKNPDFNLCWTWPYSLMITYELYRFTALSLYSIHCFTFTWPFCLTSASDACFGISRRYTFKTDISLFWTHSWSSLVTGIQLSTKLWFSMPDFRTSHPSAKSPIYRCPRLRTSNTKNEKKHKRKDMQQRCHKWG